MCITCPYNHLQELWCDITLFINYTISQQTGPPSERSHIITIITIMSHYDHFHHATVWLYKFPLVCVSMCVCVSVCVCEFNVCVCVFEPAGHRCGHPDVFFPVPIKKTQNTACKDKRSWSRSDRTLPALITLCALQYTFLTFWRASVGKQVTF